MRPNTSTNSASPKGEPVQHARAGQVIASAPNKTAQQRERQETGRTVVVFWSDVQARMLLLYASDCMAKHFEIVDVGSVSIESPCECLLLITISLIGGIKDIVQVKDLTDLCLDVNT